MNVRLALLGVALATGCQPPPEIQLNGTDGTDEPDGGDPTVSIAFPPPVDPDGGGPYEFERQDVTEDWDVVVAVDIDGLDMVDPYTNPPPELADGEGHWHLDSNITGVTTLVVSSGSVEFEVPSELITPGQTAVLTVSLRNNEHGALNDSDGDPIEAVVEIALVDP